MEISLTKLLLLAFVVLIVFGGGKFPNAMRDLGRGIRSFKKGLNDGGDDKETEIDNSTQKSLDSENSESKK